MRYAWVLAHAMEYSIGMMCGVLNVITGGYYAWKNREPSAQQRRREELMDAVLTFHADTKGAYRYRKVHEDIVETFARATTRRDPQGTIFGNSNNKVGR